MIAGLAFALLSVAAVSAQVTVNTPSVPVYCQPTLLTWSGGTAPYYITINQGGSTTNTLETLLSGTTDTQYTWTVDVAAGTSITVAVKDSTGAQNYAQAVTVAANPAGLTTCAAASTAAQSSAAVAASSATASLTTGTTGSIPSSSPVSSASALSSLSSVASSISRSSVAESSSASSRASSASSSASTTGRLSSAAAAASSASSAIAAASSAVTGAGVATKSASIVTLGLAAVGALALLA